MASEIDAAGISVLPGPVIELPPLHGILGHDIADAAAMEHLVRTRLAELLQAPALAPKLSVLIDGGGVFGLSAISADIRLVAIAPSIWMVAIAGDGHHSRPIAKGTADQAVDAVGDVLRLLISMGRHRRCRDIGGEWWPPSSPSIDVLAMPGPSRGKTAPTGIHTAPDGQIVLGLKPRFGQIRGADMVGFLNAVESFGIRDIRPAPGRCFFLTGLTPQGASSVQELATHHGLSADAHDPSDHIAACAGAGACASGSYATKTLAETMAARCCELLDGTLTVHLSGCSKGCAHPRQALTLTGAEGGYSLILDGRASDPPDAQIASGDIDSAIEKLARLIKNEGHAGESAAACLRRLGKGYVTRALRQG
jgi:precorrin-3B synthase